MSRAIPELLYHGTVTSDITNFEPRKRYTPGDAETVPRVYATDRPLFAAMHAFPWSSDEGIDITVREDTLCLQVPKGLSGRLKQAIYVYTLSGATFNFTEEEVTGNTYHTEEPVAPLAVKNFTSVADAIEYYGGVIEIT
jgi:hypothetical protein